MVLDEQQKLGNKTLTNRIRESMMRKATDVVQKALLTNTEASLKTVLLLLLLLCYRVKFIHTCQVMGIIHHERQNISASYV